MTTSEPPQRGAITRAEIERRMGYHPATGTQPELYQDFRRRFIELAEHVVTVLPPGRETSETVTLLEDALMWANKAVATNGVGASD